jgi:putative ABC transport system substrate-binding protein
MPEPTAISKSFSQQRVGAVLVGNSTFYARRAEQLAALAARHALLAMFPFREHALAGGLISYGSSLGYEYHQVGIYTGRSYRCSRSQKSSW